MPRRSILSAAERESLLALPNNRDDLIRRYTLSESDLSIIRQRRTAATRLGFAVQLCYLRFPGLVLGVDQLPSAPLLHLVANQLEIPVEVWADYGGRAETRREHSGELQTVFGFEPFTTGHHRLAVQELMETAKRTDKGILLATTLVEMLRARAILLPRLNTIERVCAEAVTRANRLIYKQLSDGLTAYHLARLDHLLTHKEDSSLTWLGWLRQSPLKPNSRHVLEHIERLQLWRALNLPYGIGLQVHQNRLLKIAREGGQMTSGDLMKFERDRRYATLVALSIEGMATITDESSAFMTGSLASCSTPQSISIKSSFRPMARRSMRSSGFTAELARFCLKPSKAAAIPSPRLKASSPGKILPQASQRRRSSRNLKTSTSSTG